MRSKKENSGEGVGGSGGGGVGKTGKIKYVSRKQMF